jgi:VanZ family protein
VLKIGRRVRVSLLVFYLGLIFFMSSRPYLQLPGPDMKSLDKLAHGGEYFLLGLLLFAAIGRGLSRSRLGTFLFLLAVGASIGALDEIFQSYIPGREMSIYDWLSDVTGAALSTSLAVYFRLSKRSPAKPGPGRFPRRGETG